MSLQVVQIIFKDDPSKINKDLTDFLRRNIEKAILTGGLHFQFKIAKPNDMIKLREQGVKRLPVMFVNNKPFVGVPVIIDEIRNRTKSAKTPPAAKSEEEIINDFQLKALEIKKDSSGNYIINDEEPLNNGGIDLLGKVNSEMARRDKANPQKDGAPTKPARDQERDDNDFGIQTTTIQRNKTNLPPARAPARPNNIDDLSASFGAIRMGASSRDRQDDDLIMNMLGQVDD